MRELWPVVRANHRRRLVSTVALSVLIGVAFGVTAGAAVGARRTATAFPRFADSQATPDLTMYVGDEAPPVSAIRDHPQVEAAGVGTGVGVLLRNPDGSPDFDRDAFGAIVSDGVFGHEVDHPLVLAGRLPQPDAPYELMLDENAVRTSGAGVGDVIPALAFDVAAIERVSAEFEASGREPTQADLDEVFTAVDFEVVGIGRTSGAVLTNEAVVGEPSALLSSAFLDVHPHTASYTVAVVDLVDPADVGDYVNAVRRDLPGLEVRPVDQAGLRVSFAAAVRPYWMALAFFAAVFAAGAGFALGPAVARTVDDDLGDRATLLAIGATRRQLLAVAAVRVAIILGAAVTVGVAVALAASGRFPIGPARGAEPAPGHEVHLAGMAIGAALLFSVTGGVVALRVASASRRSAVRAGRPSMLATRAGSLGLSPAALTGIHAALGGQAGRSRRLAASVGVAAALAVAIGALGFGSGLSRLVDEPVRFGWNWDVLFENYDSEIVDDTAQAIRDDPGVTGVVPISRGSVTIENETVPAIGLDLGWDGDVAPTVLDGRPPTAAGEVALGAVTARHLGVGVGDTVLGVTDDSSRPLEVVGISVMPSLALDSSSQLGQGAFLVRDDYEEMAGWYPTAALANLVDGETVEALAARFPFGVSPLDVQRPADVIAYDGIDDVPRLLAAVLGLLSVAVLVHQLIGSVRGRRHELAVLRTLGLGPRQVAWSVLWQSNVLAATVVVFAVPLGLAGGRAAWRWFATGIGVADDPLSPTTVIAAGAVVVAVAANVVALWPARRAASIHPARTLRIE